MTGRVAAVAVITLVLAAVGAMTVAWVDLTYHLDRLAGAAPAETPPLEARFNDPSGVYVDGRGRVFFSIRRQHRVWMLADGTLTLVAGIGKRGFSGDGRAAVRARLNHPEGITGDADGNLYVADSENHRIRIVSPDGVIRTFAGTGAAGWSGDGEPATWARLNRPMDVAAAPGGSLLVADWGNHRIRLVDDGGIIVTVAGTGEAGFSGDGGPATAARINEAYGVAAGEDGVWYIADSTNHRVRRVDASGVIVTIAGSGEAGHAGDGGPAVKAQFDSPQDLALEPGGGLLVNDEHNHRLRRVLPDGTVLHFAGNGTPDLCGDGGLVEDACLNDPEGIAFGPGGDLWLTDGDNHRLRHIGRDGTITTVAGSGPVGKQ
jgi:sugar lactone lactonase YvrE